jgi:hypothetical protein
VAGHSFCVPLSETVPEAKAICHGPDRDASFSLSSPSSGISPDRQSGITRRVDHDGGGAPTVEYQLARLHEDLISILPDVLETVPPDIARQFRNNSISATIQRLRQAWSAQVDEDPGLDLAVEALGARGLDTGYLSPSAGIWIWTTDERAIIEWDNRDGFHEGRPVWTAQIARWK